MAKFFINRPIVAMVISIIMVILGVIAMVQLPIAQFPDIAPPEIMLQATYVGADAVYPRKVGRHSHRADDERGGQHDLHVLGQREQRPDVPAGEFRHQHRPNDDQILTQMRYSQAESQLPADVGNSGSRSKIHDQSSRPVLALLTERHL